MLRALALLITLVPAALRAEPVLTPVQVAPAIWAIEGPTGQRDPQNLGNNSTHGLIVTNAGAVLIDAGGSWQGAAALHDVIRELTDQPVTHVINTGGQDHRWLGNGYWRAAGARIIASEAAVADQTARASLQLSMLAQLIGPDALAGTEPAFADTVFADDLRLSVGDTDLHLIHTAGAHTPGDTLVWHAASRTAFAGDIVYVGRLLGVLEFSDTRGWLDSFAALEALDPAHVVPGHGPATDLDRARADTRDYLTALRAAVETHIAAGGDMTGAGGLDQSAFAYLEGFDTLAGRNALAAFSQMEWE